MTVNRVWADLIVEELLRCGVEYFCLSPGFRSAPLAMAVVAHPKARYVMHYDERGSAFFALGVGRATGKPVAWITTSGTAAANGFPAVIEAAADGVSILALTADRPPELRKSGANQTIEQVGLFGGYPRWAVDLPVPDLLIDPSFVLTTMDQAVYRACRRPRGPVHINMMFRAPLAHIPKASEYEEYLSSLAVWKASGAPYTTYAPEGYHLAQEQIEAAVTMLQTTERGVLVAGRLSSVPEGQAVLRLADKLGWPLLPDIASQIRLGAATDRRVTLYDNLLDRDSFREGHAPDAVLHIGGSYVSKGLLQFLAEACPQPYIVVNNTPDRLDPQHQVTFRVETEIVTFCDALGTLLPKKEDTSYLSSWRAAGACLEDAHETFFSGQSALTEPFVAHTITQHIPEGHALVLASSMPIRDANRFACGKGTAAFVVTNRGASGIDGIIATTAGVAEGLGQPVTVLAGDLALLHDLNALALAKGRPMVIVVINNNGGGIFHFLSVDEREKYFEKCFGTPHDLSFEAAARLYGIDYFHPTSPQAFTETYVRACTQRSTVLIEVTTDRGENHVVHQKLLSLGM